ncbi:hypothetical protein [Rhizohabitans arisaemae]|uniref:hypothetical protein n=1 Tax=Rhizohabitans arisaemae TaxID=2720610 RepID=UPI0024B1EE5E|nr:hypothetical protein [Rhizohabitans arisaemae]
MTPTRTGGVSGLASSAYLYTFFDTPEKLATGRPHRVIAVGEIAAVDQGRDLYSDEDDNPRKFIVLRVRVTDLVKDCGGYVRDGHVYVEFFQSGLNADGSPRVSLRKWRKWLPVGARVALFLAKTYQRDRAVHGTRGLGPGAVLMRSDPQGFLMERPDGGRVALFGGNENPPGAWRDITSVDEVAVRARRALEKRRATAATRVPAPGCGWCLGLFC